MSVDATMHVARPGRRDACLDWLQMLTGAGLVLFMWCHMLLVSSVVLSPKIMDAIAHFFEVTYMAQVGGPVIFLTMITHFVLAARKIPFRAEDQKTIWEHAKMMRHADTWLWVVQAVTAMIVLVMGSVHLFVVLSDLPITAAKSAARVQAGWGWFYLVLLPSIELHVSVGFHRIGVKWGFIRTGNRSQAKKAENIMFAVFMGIGLVTLLRFAFLG